MVLYFTNPFFPFLFPVPIREFLAVAGGEARLPCNIAIPKEPDIISLILWYREAPKSPIYTLDFRKGLPDDAKHFPGKMLMGRAHFETNEYPPTLIINKTYVEDEGVYKCRIEYKRARTVTRLVKLIIIASFNFDKLLNDPNGYVKYSKLLSPVPKGEDLKRKRRNALGCFSDQAHRTKKKRMVLWIIVTTTMILKSFCCRRSNDGEGNVEFQELLDSYQVVQSVERKENAVRKVRRQWRGQTKLDKRCCCGTLCSQV
ncbi:hypothetical protein AVEN_213257-1 [Araneus ventricosus]|uniref:Ig-like domain-containing protein n=1 Tax=Araneus ventricosus TaxID=182803 RepID=A0A4Y2DDT5_ARAVE|nr:hypothetical protein AVEN_213257-1 [Araneus ventricosus]